MRICEAGHGPHSEKSKIVFTQADVEAQKLDPELVRDPAPPGRRISSGLPVRQGTVRLLRSDPARPRIEPGFCGSGQPDQRKDDLEKALADRTRSSGWHPGSAEAYSQPGRDLPFER